MSRLCSRLLNQQLEEVFSGNCWERNGDLSDRYKTTSSHTSQCFYRIAGRCGPCFSLSYFPAFFTCEFYLACDRQLRKIFAAYFEYTSLTNLCVLIADRYVAIVMPFQLCIIHDVKMRGYHGDSQLAASSGLLLSSGDDIKTAGFRRHHDNFQNTIRICVSAHTLLFAATFDNTDVLHRVQALEKNDNSCFTVTI